MSVEPSAQHLTLPVDAYLQIAYRWLDDFNGDPVGDPYDPNAQPAFLLCRALKGHPSLRSQPVDEVFALIRSLWNRKRAPVRSATPDLLEEDFEVAFYDAWDRVRFPVGTDPVALACELAGNGLIRTQKKRPGRYERFLTVAALLQIEVRRQPILLPVHKLAEHMPCQANSVSAWTRWAIADGVLIRTATHYFRPGGDSRAAEYVFGLHEWKREAIERVAALLQVVVTDEDRAWTQRQFTNGRAAG